MSGRMQNYRLLYLKVAYFRDCYIPYAISVGIKLPLHVAKNFPALAKDNMALSANSVQTDKKTSCLYEIKTLEIV